MNFLEEIIQEAQLSGKFKNLKGEGRPLKIDDPAFGKESRLAYSMVKEAGFTLAFIAERKKLAGRIDETRAELEAVARRRDGTPWGEIRWRKGVDTFRDAGAALNKVILTYNLKAPHVQFHILPLDVEGEIAALEKSSP